MNFIFFMMNESINRSTGAEIHILIRWAKLKHLDKQQ